jgi:prepilin-type N-terminal cleavage/methylation domain-containing protein
MKKMISFQFGFSLIEISIVLIIVGLLLGSALVSLQAQRDHAQLLETSKNLNLAKESLLGYMRVYGRIPCPATEGSNGIEQPLGGGECFVSSGYFPSATLGFQPLDRLGFAVDAWNNRIRYVVAKDNNFAFTKADGINNEGLSNLKPSLKVCSDSNKCSDSFYLTNNAVAIIYSTGKNYGISAGEDEIKNLNASSVLFSREHTSGKQNKNEEFDDIVTWISPYLIYNAMTQSGQLH